MIIQSLLIAIASLTVFLILTEVLTISISYGEKTVIDLDLTFFGIRLTKTKNEKQNKKGRKKRFRPDFYTITEFIRRLFSKSDVTVRFIRVYYPDDDPAESAIKIGLFNSLISTAIAYAEAYSKKFQPGNITFLESANNSYKIEFDISLRLSLISFIAVLIRLQSGRRSEGANYYGRKQNE